MWSNSRVTEVAFVPASRADAVPPSANTMTDEETFHAFFQQTAAPLRAYVVGVLVVLMLGNTLVQFSKHLPSAGGYYTYVSRSLSPRAGFITSWMYVLYSPLSGGPIYGFFGFILAGELKAHYDINVPWLWWVCILVGAPIVAFLQYRGIRISVRTVVILGAAEILIVLALTGVIFAMVFTSASAQLR